MNKNVPDPYYVKPEIRMEYGDWIDTKWGRKRRKTMHVKQHDGTWKTHFNWEYEKPSKPAGQTRREEWEKRRKMEQAHKGDWSQR